MASWHADLFGVGGPDYPHKLELLEIYDLLRKLEMYLQRRPPGKAIEVLWSMKFTVYAIAQAIQKVVKDLPEDRQRLGLGVAQTLLTQHYPYPNQVHLIRKACEETELDYDHIVGLFHTVYRFDN